MRQRVLVFLDYQNVHAGARRAFLPYGCDRADGHVDPRALGELLVRRRKFAGELVGVRAYRGRPNPEHQPGSARANDRQKVVWERRGVEVIRRNLQYPKRWPDVPASEKGIDVAIAVDMVRLSLSGGVDAIVLFSSDSDLLPAVEFVNAMEGVSMEVASWAKQSRLRFPDTQLPYCHYVSEAEWHDVRDQTDYAAP